MLKKIKIDSFLICDHKSDILQEEIAIKKNSFLDLLFEKSDFEEYSTEFSRKNFEGKLICKNVILIYFLKYYFLFKNIYFC